jgi:hypothetical protein
MRSGSRLVWLGLTPEPERELPVAVATLRAHRARGAGAPTGRELEPWIEAEVRRIDALILHGTQRTWLRYLSEVTALIQATAPDPTPEPTPDPNPIPDPIPDPDPELAPPAHTAEPTPDPVDHEVSCTFDGVSPLKLHDQRELTGTAGAAAGDRAVTLHAAETVLEHHRMLIGLPGRAYERVSGDREALARVVAQLRGKAVRT